MARDKILCYEDYRDEVEPVIAMHGKAEYIDFLAYFYRRSLGQDLPEYVDGPATPVVSTQVNAGRWLWQCVACRNAVQVSRDIDRSLCTRCGWQGCGESFKCPTIAKKLKMNCCNNLAFA